MTTNLPEFPLQNYQIYDKHLPIYVTDIHVYVYVYVCVHVYVYVYVYVYV